MKLEKAVRLSKFYRQEIWLIDLLSCKYVLSFRKNGRAVAGSTDGGATSQRELCSGLET